METTCTINLQTKSFYLLVSSKLRVFFLCFLLFFCENISAQNSGALEFQPDMICLGQSFSDLSIFAMPTGGSFSGPGVTQTNGIFSFNAQNAGLGSHNIVYTYFNTQGAAVNVSDNITVVNTVPIVIAPFVDLDLCLGQSQILSIANPLAGVVYTWSPSVTNLGSGGSTVLLSPNSSTSFSVSYNSNGCSGSTNVGVTVFPIPTNLVLNSNNSCDDACNGSIDVSYNYNGPNSDLSFSWYFNGQLQIGQSTSHYANACPGNYHCTITTINGCTVSSANTVLTNNTTPSYFTSISDNTCISNCGGSISVSSSTQFSIVWNSGSVAGSTLPSLNGLCAGDYSYSISFANGCSVNSTIALSENFGTTNYSSINSFVSILANPNVVISGNIEVNNGGTLYISASTLKFSKYGRLIVHPGGKLILEQGILTHSCPDQYWLGVIVEGTNTETQIEVANPQAPSNGVVNQGWVYINKNSRIEYALVGIRANGLFNPNDSQWPLYASSTTLAGGFIKCEDAFFLNNRTDVSIGNYNPTNSQNLCFFYHTNFKLDQNYLIALSPLARVYLTSTSGVSFKGCTWQNVSDDLIEYGTLEAVNATFAPLRITHYVNSSGVEVYPSKIEGFRKGVHCAGALGPLVFSIEHTTFRCMRGIFLNNPPTASLFANNSFYGLNSAPGITKAIPLNLSDGIADPFLNAAGLTTGNGTACYGIYAMSGGDYRIEQNFFKIKVLSNNHGHSNENILRVGLYVTDSDTDPVEIYLNSFYDMTGGARFYNDNRGASNNATGLAIQCNIFRGNYRDVEVNSMPYMNSSSFGIRAFQFASPGFLSYNNVMDNLFPNNSNFDFDDMKNVTGNYHEYRYINGSLTPSEVSGFNAVETSSSIFCNSYLGSGLIGAGVTKSDLAGDYSNLKNIYEEIVDGGNSVDLLSNIESFDYYEAFALYTDLLSKSPSLSQEAMIELVAKELEFPAVLLTSILTNNPSAAKSGVVQKLLDERVYSLSDFQREMINLGKQIVSEKEVIEAEMADKIAQFHRLNSVLYFEHIKDTLDTNRIQAWQELMSTMPNDFVSSMIELRWLIDCQKFEEAKFLCAELSSSIHPKLSEYEDLIKLGELIPILEKFQVEDEFSLDDQTIQVLQDYLDHSWPNSYGYALSMLLTDSEFLFEEETNYPVLFLEQRSLNNKLGQDKLDSWLDLYPNPSSDLLFLRLQHAPISVNANAVITDLLGKTVRSISIPYQNFEYVLDLRGLEPGLYNLEILDMGQIVHNQKVIVK